MRALMGVRDPFGIMLAVAAAVVLLLFQEGPLVAVLAAVSVLAFRAVGGAVFDRWLPRPPTAPKTQFPPVPFGQPWYHPLTKRESEVALLIVDGHTNKQIAAELTSERTVDGHLSERGVASHVQNIMNSLSDEFRTHVGHRAQIAAWVAERRPRDNASVPAKPR
ncbi:MAG: LuxR C-terminal-related transcriptional regulator [Chloroflexota bacterium]